MPWKVFNWHTVGAKNIHWLTPWINKMRSFIFRTLLIIDSISLWLLISLVLLISPCQFFLIIIMMLASIWVFTLPWELYSLFIFFWNALTPTSLSYLHHFLMLAQSLCWIHIPLYSSLNLSAISDSRSVWEQKQEFQALFYSDGN